MKLRKKIIGLCAAGLFVTTLSITTFSVTTFASTEQDELKQQIQTYVNQIEEINLELSKSGSIDVPATITLTNNLTYEQLSQYVKENVMDIVQLQARGIDVNGERITFASLTYKGLDETDRILKSMAAEEGVEFLGYNSMYVLVDAKELLNVQNNDLTFLIEPSILESDQKNVADLQVEVSFPHSLSWSLEEIK